MNTATETVVAEFRSEQFARGRYGAPDGTDTYLRRVFQYTASFYGNPPRLYQRERWYVNGVQVNAADYPADGSAEAEAYAAKRRGE